MADNEGNLNEVNQVDEENQYIVEEADEENQVEAENEEAQISENEEFVIQEQPKKLIMSDVWEQYLTTAEIRKEDMNRLVMNFLVVEGYLEAVEKFQKESGTKQVGVASISDRLAVKRDIESGDLEDAVEKLNAINPEILKTNFSLNQQRFIERIRIGVTIKETFNFAEKELKPLVEQNLAFLEELEKTVAILRFRDLPDIPEAERELLDNSRWFKTAAEVNAAILTSQTGLKCPKLLDLLKMLTWTQNQLDEKVEYPRMSVLPTGQLTVINPPWPSE
ncbi:CTLH/CRA C-terminal to LisH motif domain [Arabidopsis thaliana x Arabidopsis arenosa]|uniref:CTLH/CRA C-terminal to LisH motif domain n=1 Tax=Arabidopsis thaliana x Arabidopsis arenosa TaxID=1240361 RepID=A0A8T2GFF7_9BRAS|nr:CTLH/CRA C-terminal to LisH motif domain [Arabidopsis thaliana x Arabidopsis arenosa]